MPEPEKNVTVQDIEAIARKYPAEKRFALAIMQDVQREFSYLPQPVFEVIHRHIGTPVAHLYALATFYKALSLKPKGQNVIKLCDGTACHMRGASNLSKGIRAALDIEPGESSADGLFSLELVNCVGSCALAPVMVINETYYGKVTMESLPAIIAEHRRASCEDTAASCETEVVA
ncbi:MAG: NAD(P)H-dependent oxidoreductase subunit E [Coriobacteriales bacterium]|jgi:NADH-quinone oxidoreductase subunit E|nr:NAD(P)H-dependent oxidoreductase subunit E [Coriobacteriales bacterium]